jgi:hypothetical protein
MTPDKFRERLETWVGQFTRTQEKFLENLARNPAYALTWADSMFEATGKYEVAMQMKTYFDRPLIEDGDTWEKRLEVCKETCDREMARMAGQFNQSTSPSSNLVDRAKLTAFAKLFDYWG